MVISDHASRSAAYDSWHEASGEAGYPNLFCTRTSRGRYQIVFYKDSVQVYDLQDPKAEPLEPKYSFKWIARQK
jgi:hypothetical protein